MNTQSNTVKESVSMKRITRQLLLGLVAAATLAACQQAREERSYVQTNVLRKDVLEGEWYYQRTVVDHNFESSLYTFKGDETWDYTLGTLARIRWIIDENYLYAVRTYETIEGANFDAVNSNFLGEPIAAYSIDSHFDIQRQYNPLTGETSIVTEENTQDRMWWDREYMRVDWTTNNVIGYFWASLEANEAFGYVTREPAALMCDEGSAENDCPANWLPRVDTAECPDSCRDVMRVPPGTEADFEAGVRACATEMGMTTAQVGEIQPPTGVLTWADLAPWWTLGCQYVDELVDDPTTGDAPPYYLSIVNHEIWSSKSIFGLNCDVTYGYPCTSFRIAVRHTFLRSTNVPDYEPLNVPNSMNDRFGVIRMMQQRWARGGLPDEEEGLTRDYGITDALNYWGARHDMWANDLQVDPSGHRIPGQYRPIEQRSVKPILYTMSAHYLPYLVDPSMTAAWQWNLDFMRTVRTVRNQAWPEDGGAPWGCELVHPTCPPTNTQCDPHDIASYGGSLSQWDSSAFQHHFEGPECALILQVNPCDRDPNLPCAELGDIRYHFWALIDTPGTSFGGVSLPMQDPRDGRLVSANVNITHDDVEMVSTGLLLELGLAAPGELTNPAWEQWINTEEGLMSGEFKREYFAKLGKVEFPRQWAPYGPVASRMEGVASALYDPLLAPNADELNAGIARLQELKPKLEKLHGIEGRAMTLSNRLFSLAGTQFERDSMDIMDTLSDYRDTLPQGLNGLSDSLRPTDDQVLAQVSPFRRGFGERLAEMRAKEAKLTDSRHCFMPIEPLMFYSDESIARIARDFGSYSPAQIAIEYRRRLIDFIFRHEFGHSIGMEHNYGASADTANYLDGYYEIAAKYPYPDFTDYSTCTPEPDPHTGDPICGETGEDMARYWADVDAVKRQREAAGVDSEFFSSVMDYTQSWVYSNILKNGRYDRAYTLFAYGGRREVYVGDPRSYGTRAESIVPYGTCTEGSRGLECTHECDVATDGTVTCPWLPKLPLVYYIGGNRCETDADCPYAYEKNNLWPGDAAHGYPAQRDLVAQRCVENYRQRELDTSAPMLPKQCSNWEEDWKTFANDPLRVGAPPYYPVLYKNCGDSRTGDISWCTQWDEGESFRQVVENYREEYERSYLFSHFRLYRNNYGGTSLWRYLDTIGKIFQHFWFRLFYEGGDFDFTSGPQFGYGAWDQFLASADALNFLASVITTPDVGSYEYDSISNSYTLKDSEEYGTGDLDLHPGLGKYLWSRFETGLNGFFRQARQGLIRNKLEAMMALVLREWGMTYGMDERYYFNFYDVFTSEMNILFSGLMLDNAGWYGPRMTGTEADPRLSYPYFWQGFICGAILFGGGQADYCTQDVRSQFPGIPAVGGGSNVIMRNYALAFALAEFPVFFNTSYEQQMYVALDGGGDYFDVPGCDVPAMIAADAKENDVCVIYESRRLHKTYVAVKVGPREPWTTDWAPMTYQSISGELLHEMNALGTLIEQLNDPATPPGELPEECRTPTGLDACLERAQGRLQNHETFVLSLTDMMHRYGISSWF